MIKMQQLSVSDVDDDLANSVDSEHETEDVELDQVCEPHQIRNDHQVESLRDLKELARTNPRAAKLWISSYFCESAASANGILAALKYPAPTQDKLRRNLYPICQGLPGWPTTFKWPTNTNGDFHRKRVSSLIYIFLGLTFSAGTCRRVGNSHPEYLNCGCEQVQV